MASREHMEVCQNTAELLITYNLTLLRGGRSDKEINASKMLINKPLRGISPFMIRPQVST